MTTIGFIRGSGLPVSSKTSSTIDSQIQSKSALNATAEHAEQIEANHRVVFDCADLRLTGTAGFPSGLSAHASLDLPESVAACLWHATGHGSVKWVAVPARVPHPLRSVLGTFGSSFIGTFCGFFVGTPWPRDIHPHRYTAALCPSTDDRLWAAPSNCSQLQHGAATFFRRGPSAGSMYVYAQPARCLQ